MSIEELVERLKTDRKAEGPMIQRSYAGPVLLPEATGPKAYVRADRCGLGKPLTVFGPKRADHLTIGERCPGCHRRFSEGEFTVLIAIGPGADPEARERAQRGRFYSAVVIEVHLECATGTELVPSISVIVGR